MIRRPISISLRLTLWFGATLLGGWLLFGGAMWFNLKHALSAERKQTLDRRIDRLQDLLQRDAASAPDARYVDFHDFAAATGNGLVEVFRTSGERYWPSPSTAAANFPWPSAEMDDDEQFVHVIARGQPYWTVKRSARIGDTSVVIEAAAPEASNILLLNRFWNSLIASAPLLLVVSMAGGYWISRRALRPVDEITVAARSIGIRNLSERLPMTHTSDELERLAATCNDMLDRLEEAVRKLKQFTADASHELRGPLTLTRTIAEVALRNPQVDADSRASFEEIAQEAARSATLLEHMLELARADAEPVDIPLELVDIGSIVGDACADAQTLAEPRDISLTTHSKTAWVLGHAPSLRRLLWILLDNAIKYTPTGGSIDVAIHRAGQTVTVKIGDTGIGIAAEDLPRVFDRFYRADPSRSEIEGNGLGLAIAKWITDLHRANIEIESRVGIGTTVTVHFDR